MGGWEPQGSKMRPLKKWWPGLTTQRTLLDRVVLV